MTEKLQPKLRFRGFTDPWEQRKLGEVGEIIGGGTPDTKKSLYWDGPINWFTPAEIGGTVFVNESKRTITLEGLNSCSAKLLPKNNTILFTSRAGIGSTAILLEDACTNQGFQSLVVNNSADVYCIYSLSNQIKSYAEKKASGSTFLEISGKQLSLMQIKLPSLNEQKRIGSFFQKLDSLISLHERKLELLKKKKQAYLQQIFTQKLRFKGFTEPWEQRKLGEVCSIVMGQSPDGKTYRDVPSDYILVQGNADLINGWVVPRIWTTQKIKTAQAGDLIITVRAPAGSVGKTSYDIVIGRGVAAIKGNEFIYQCLLYLHISGYWKKIASGSTFESISSEDLYNAIIPFTPDMKEQESIGNILFNYDLRVDAEERLISLLRQKKQAYLQKMFV